MPNTEPTHFEHSIDTDAVLDALDAYCEELYALAEKASSHNTTPQLAYNHALQKALRMRMDVTKLLLIDLRVV
jgi:hypothetical protein